MTAVPLVVFCRVAAPFDEPPEWAALGFSSCEEWAEWGRWRTGLAAGHSDPDEWIEFPGEGRWYRNRDLLHVRQLAALAAQLPAQPEAPQAEPAEADLDDLLERAGYERA